MLVGPKLSQIPSCPGIWRAGGGEALVYKTFALGIFVAIIGPALFIGSSIADAQIGGALQYPPPSVGEDAQPPPPARMAPQSVSPRRIELGVSGSSQLPADYHYRVHPRSDID